MIRAFQLALFLGLAIAGVPAAACPGYDIAITQASGSAYNPTENVDTPLNLLLSSRSGPLPADCAEVPVRIEGLPGDPEPLRFRGPGGAQLATELLSSPEASFAFQSLLLTADARARLARGQTVTVQVGRLRAGQAVRTGPYRTIVRVIAGANEASGALSVRVEPSMLLRTSSANGVEDILLTGDPQTGASGSTVFFYRSNADLRISAFSRNRGELVHQQGRSIGRIPYIATLDGVTLDFSRGPARLDLNSVRPSLRSITLDVVVPPSGPLPAGRYEDVITLRFAAF